jgi:hypothetical protein
MPDYVFLTGHRKAGTTMLRGLFDGHCRATTYPADVGLLYAYFPCFTRAENRTSDELRERVSLVLKRSLSSVNELTQAADVIEVEPFIESFWKQFADGDLLRRSAILDALGNTWCRRCKIDPDGATVIFKETSQSIFFDELRADFPSLKMIHLVRDPRDNYAALKVGVSRYYSTLGENELETLASLINRCRMDLIAARINAERHPETFLAIRFEDVVASPKTALGRACEFLGWDFSDSMLSPTILGETTAGNSHEGKRFSGISGENAGAWRKRISEDEAKVIEYWCEREMLDWGYAVEFDAIERQKAFAQFYEWYNCRYFFSDSFSRR